MKNARQPSVDPRNSALSRRAVLGGSASLAAASALAPKASARPGGSNKPVLVQVFLRGGMDGLTTVAPYGDPDLYNLRPNIAVRPPGQPNGALDLDGFFGLAPAAAPLLTPYGNGHLAIVHASGSTDPTRSHFEAYERMEYADPAVPYGGISSGWAARYLVETPSTSPLRGISIGALPLSLRQAPNTLPVRNFSLEFPGLLLTSAQRQAAILDTYARRSPIVRAPALNTIAAFSFGGVDFDNYVPSNGAVYPASGFGQSMKDMAALIKAEVGVEVLMIDIDHWDLHAALGPINGLMAGLLQDLTNGLEAFYLDMLGNLDDYVLVCISEFGRHAQENGSGGADHGHGNALFVMGGNVNGGQVISNWPGLAEANLDNGDLAITIDYRDVLGEILVERLGVGDPSAIFPQHTFTSHGVIA